MKEKIACFEYLVDQLSLRNNDGLDGFTTLKLIKLLFLVVGVSSNEDEEGLTRIFNRFSAMPYGPVESDIYTAIQTNKLNKYYIDSSSCTIKEDCNINPQGKNRQEINDAIEQLLIKNPKILQSQPFELVDITHKWSCWRTCYNIALSNNKHSIDMPARMIQKSVKYYQ